MPRYGSQRPITRKAGQAARQVSPEVVDHDLGVVIAVIVSARLRHRFILNLLSHDVAGGRNPAHKHCELRVVGVLDRDMKAKKRYSPDRYPVQRAGAPTLW